MLDVDPGKALKCFRQGYATARILKTFASIEAAKSREIPEIVILAIALESLEKQSDIFLGRLLVFIGHLYLKNIMFQFL